MGPNTPFRISCPGKVLIVGGYAILYPENKGLVLTTSARFYSDITTNLSQNSTGYIEIRSSRFDTVYAIKYNAKGIMWRVSEATNVYVEYVVTCIVTYVVAWHELHEKGVPLRFITVDLNADDAFYGARREVDQEIFKKDGGSFHKTGIGSSAALTASLTGALLYTFFPSENETKFSYRFLEDAHVLAQLAHFQAQGGKGSGFDICSAVYGTGIYRRFSPEIFSGVSFRKLESSISLENFFRSYLCGNVRLDHYHEQNNLGSFSSESEDGKDTSIHIVLAQAGEGSSTRSMVHSVMKHLQEHPNSTAWASLVKANHEFMELWGLLLETSCSSSSEEICIHMQRVFRRIRESLRTLGLGAKCPVEPLEYEAVLNCISDIKGVICAGCPGSGGYDAIFAVVKGLENKRLVQHFLSHTVENQLPEFKIIRADLGNKGIVMDKLD